MPDEGGMNNKKEKARMNAMLLRTLASSMVFHDDSSLFSPFSVQCSTQQKTTFSLEMETTATSLWRSLGFAIFPETLTVICLLVVACRLWSCIAQLGSSIILACNLPRIKGHHGAKDLQVQTTVVWICIPCVLMDFRVAEA